MAEFQFDMDDFSGLEKQVEEIFKEALEQAKPGLKEATRAALSTVTRSDLPSKAIAYSKGKFRDGTRYAVAYPSHSAKVRGTDAGTAAFMMEYGTGAKGRNRKGQPSRPWVDKANAIGESTVTDAVEAVVDKFQEEYSL